MGKIVVIYTAFDNSDLHKVTFIGFFFYSYLCEGELQTGGIVRHCDGENSCLVATVTADRDPAAVQVKVPNLTHRRKVTVFLSHQSSHLTV